MSNARKILNLLLLLLFATSSCATRTDVPASRRAPPTPAPTPAAVAVDVSRAGAGAYNQYKFTYRREGGETEVRFAPEPLPWNDLTVVAAAREVLVAAYEDRSENFPRRAAWPYKGETANAIKLEGEKFEYVFLPLKEERGETKRVRTILFWQLVKGTVK